MSLKDFTLLYLAKNIDKCQLYRGIHLISLINGIKKNHLGVVWHFGEKKKNHS